MNELTIGKLEEKLREFPKGTKIHVGCGCCHHGAMGNESIMGIVDNTNQTYGHIEIVLNNTSPGSSELNKDKEEWYKGEIEKLKRELKAKDFKLKCVSDSVQSIESSVRLLEIHSKMEEK